MEGLVVPPFVASGIVAHAKRMRNSAGYLFGSYSDGQITVTDYIPCTHEFEGDKFPQWCLDEFKARVDVKKHYNSGVAVIGWYVAGAPEPGGEAVFKRWCEAPGVIFARGGLKSQALMLLARMPCDGDMTLKWEAYITNNSIQEEVHVCERKAQKLNVTIAAESPSMNVLLAEIASKALYGGGTPHATSRITSLDLVARGAEMMELEGNSGNNKRDNNRRDGDRPVEEALMRVQNGMMQDISNAESALAGGNNNKEGNLDSAAIVESYKRILEEKGKQGERGDFITESYTDALAIKYQMFVLRRVLNDIERNNNPESRERPHHGGGIQGNRPNRGNNTR
ncbi:uncharacterized protein TEOVI_000540600 [Trypanosoma equiperdum]|nr:hypothetical protein, conserved [Trypanosoma brucei gambiense DAL972]CBH09813.1 hypothetical protein, conserved [Trypanosoma brucei gambiense DAL972]SCU64925.1 hypothetical protein, conserved [Trypanosoma equiperdum]|eukprot:XP_011772106.1 hypothetical protein, conserved [Trypanosoma brucei gambiense DAL972]